MFQVNKTVLTFIMSLTKNEIKGIYEHHLFKTKLLF